MSEHQRVHAAVTHDSATGTVHALAEAMTEGAEQAGAEVRFRRCRELAPASAIEANERWKAHADAVRDVAEATVDDVVWADLRRWGARRASGRCGPARAAHRSVRAALVGGQADRQGDERVHVRSDRARRSRNDPYAGKDTSRFTRVAHHTVDLPTYTTPRDANSNRKDGRQPSGDCRDQDPAAARRAGPPCALVPAL
jgi:hypothetical protein